MRLLPLRLLGLLLSAVVALTLASATPSGAVPADDLPRTTSSDTAQARAATREPLERWTCGPWKSHGGIGWRSCARLYDLKDKIKIDYRERFYNDSRREPMTIKCEHAKTTTWTFGASVTVESEMGAIFAKVKGSVTGSVSRASATTRTAGLTRTVQPRQWAHCERGIHGYTYSGLVRRQVCDRATPGGGCRYDNVKSFSGSAPEAGFWRSGDGRGGVDVMP